MCAILLNVLLIVILTMQILGYKHSVARDTSDSNYTMEGNVSDSTQTVEAASNVSKRAQRTLNFVRNTNRKMSANSSPYIHIIHSPEGVSIHMQWDETLLAI